MTDNSNIKLVNEYARLYSQSQDRCDYISVEALFNIPHPNALQRYARDDKSGVHLNGGGKNDLLNWIAEALPSDVGNTNKRLRSENTPPSAEKVSKERRTDSAEKVSKERRTDSADGSIFGP